MSCFNDQYYICAIPCGEEQVFAGKNPRTASGRYWYTKQAVGDPPLYFHNSNKEYNLIDGERWPITSVLFYMNSFLVNACVYEELKAFVSLGLQFHPAVYIDDDDVWHENFWFLVFHEGLDCWDQGKSEVSSAEVVRSDGSVRLARLKSISLDDNVLGKISEVERLMFVLGGASNHHVLFHQKIVDIFERNEFSGARFLKVSDFEDGDDVG